MPLTEYHRKRHFERTSEPRGKTKTKSSPGGWHFVIQKHAASHLHYDFRLELDGVLVSWAVPKGPSLDPAIKRLAMHVEDHPVEYGGFEGIIPQGEYGGGAVLLWDQGTWEPIGDARQDYRQGHLKFLLHGSKLQGGWMLVRKGGKHGDADERHWFLFKEKDGFADRTTDITETMPLSVTTGRDLDEIAEQATRVWGRNGEVAQKGRPSRKRADKPASPAALRRKPGKGAKGLPNSRRRGRFKKASASGLAEIADLLAQLDAKHAPLPVKAAVQLATLTKTAPEGDEWLHEIKFDGYRMLCQINHGKTRFISRNGRDWTSKFPSLVEAIGNLPVESAIVDGEIVIMEADGTTSFQALQNAFQSRTAAPFLLYAFDLLYLNSRDLREISIEDRKSLLRLILPKDAQSPLKFSDHVVGNGPAFFEEAARLHLEGIISKRRGRPYIAGRGSDWLKVKCSLREEFVIGGFTPPEGNRSHFGALLMGYYDSNHELQYAGRVGTGFNDRILASLHGKLVTLVQTASPFANLSGHTGPARGVSWVKPSLVAQVQFSNWTEDRLLRHPSFQGLREDKPARDVVREEAVAAPAVQSAKKAKKINSVKKPPRKEMTESVRPRPSSGRTEIAGVSLSHPDKIMYPDDGITKEDLAHYYEQVARWILPRVKNRLLSLVRCPGGSGEKCFFQKHPGEGTPECLRRFPVQEKEKKEEHLALYDLEGLISLVQMGVLEIHVWGSQADQFEKPDRLIFDLDPDPAVDWPHVVVAAKEVRLLLEQFDLTSFIKTTGGKGLHIVVPIRRRMDWAEAKSFCRAVADFLVAAAPGRYIAKMSKAARKGKIFVDYLRNDRGATAIAPYSTRARPGAPVSVPITWEELNNDLRSDEFNIHNLPARLMRLKKDPWAAIDSTKQSITAAMVRKLQIR